MATNYCVGDKVTLKSKKEGRIHFIGSMEGESKETFYGIMPSKGKGILVTVDKIISKSSLVKTATPPPFFFTSHKKKQSITTNIGKYDRRRHDRYSRRRPKVWNIS